MQTYPYLDYMVVLSSAALVLAPPVRSTTTVQDWLYSSSIADAESYLCRPDITGVQALYAWKSLEPEQDCYDFSQIETDLAQVNYMSKQLWVQIQDRSFNLSHNPVPEYLHMPLYNNGSVVQCDADDCDTNFVEDGWAAAQWNPHVRSRFQLLLKRLATSFDGRIYGLNFPETAIDVREDENDFDAEDYLNGTLANAFFARSVFTQSYVVQYINFWPDDWANSSGYLTDSFAFLAVHDIGVGGPDDIPFHPAQEKNSYPFMDRFRDMLPISVVAVQEPDLEVINPKTNETFTREEFTDFAVEDLGVDIIFWALSSPWLNGG